MKIPLFDVAASNRDVKEVALARIAELATTSRFILGAPVVEFEQRAAEYLGVAHAVGVSSGSDALVCALQALEIGPGDEVLTTPFSFFASVESILRVGARPRFVDIRPDTFALDPEAVERALTPATRAILVVHLFGQPANLTRLTAIAEKHGVPLVEDAAQAFGARHETPAGSSRLRLASPSGGSAPTAVGGFGTLGCFSFQPTKPLGAWGDAGLVVTHDAALAERCRRLRAHGATAKYEHAEVGGNYRLDALQSLVLTEKLPRLPAQLEQRRELAARYERALSGISELVLPRLVPGTESSRALYTVRVLNARRDPLREFLAARGVETGVYYPVPLHRQPALARALAKDGVLLERALPEAERASKEVLSIPLFPELTEEQQDSVIRGIREFFGV